MWSFIDRYKIDTSENSNIYFGNIIHTHIHNKILLIQKLLYFNTKFIISNIRFDDTKNQQNKITIPLQKKNHFHPPTIKSNRKHPGRQKRIISHWIIVSPLCESDISCGSSYWALWKWLAHSRIWAAVKINRYALSTEV